MLIFRQLLTSSLHLHVLLGDSASGEALLIDPYSSRCAATAALMRRTGVGYCRHWNTQVHADNVTGDGAQQQRVGSHIAIAAKQRRHRADRLMTRPERHSSAAPRGGARDPGHTSGGLDRCASTIRAWPFLRRLLLIRGQRQHRLSGGRSARHCQVRCASLSFAAGACMIYPPTITAAVTRRAWTRSGAQSAPGWGAALGVD